MSIQPRAATASLVVRKAEASTGSSAPATPARRRGAIAKPEEINAAGRRTQALRCGGERPGRRPRHGRTASVPLNSAQSTGPVDEENYGLSRAATSGRLAPATTRPAGRQRRGTDNGRAPVRPVGTPPNTLIGSAHAHHRRIHCAARRATNPVGLALAVARRVRGASSRCTRTRRRPVSTATLLHFLPATGSSGNERAKHPMHRGPATVPRIPPDERTHARTERCGDYRRQAPNLPLASEPTPLGGCHAHLTWTPGTTGHRKRSEPMRAQSVTRHGNSGTARRSFANKPRACARGPQRSEPDLRSGQNCPSVVSQTRQAADERRANRALTVARARIAGGRSDRRHPSRGLTARQGVRSRREYERLAGLAAGQ